MFQYEVHLARQMKSVFLVDLNIKSEFLVDLNVMATLTS